MSVEREWVRRPQAAEAAPARRSRAARGLRSPARALRRGNLVGPRREESKGPGDFVFLNDHGEQWKDVRRAWGRALKQAKLGDRPGLVFHALRHTFATHFLEGGGAITDLQAQLGHSKVSTTQRYTRMVDERRKATVLALDYGTKPATKSEPPVKGDAATATGSSWQRRAAVGSPA